MTEVEALWKVLQFIGGRSRVVFEGLEDDARKFLSDHFPRVHQEPNSGPGSADAAIVSPSGDHEIFNGQDFVPADHEGNATATATATATVYPETPDDNETEES